MKHQNDRHDINRRSFLKQTGLAAVLGAARSVAMGAAESVSIVVDPEDKIASASPSQWAVSELREALRAHGVSVRVQPRIDLVPVGDRCVVVAGAPVAQQVLKTTGISIPSSPEAFVLTPTRVAGKPVVLVCGSDVRGLVYAVLEIADRERHVGAPRAALELPKPIVERPANIIRSIARCFESDVEDKPWYYDRAMWARYLSMLAAQRFNRFSLTLGLGYNFPRQVSDVYFYFAYPFLLPVPGYHVRVTGLSDAERERNLETLRYISEETAARGLHFQLGLWTHAYKWIESPKANYTIEGLTPDIHAAYCRDALAALLKACPRISGITFRIHGESGVPEGSYSFWQTVFDGIVRCGRRVEIDMHAKGMDQKMIDVALATGMPVNVSPKYWAEHMGLPYHQAAIRDLEMPRPESREGKVESVFALSSGSRRFLRYGYGDLLTEDRRYGILHRIWPGTQRILLWGDPALAAGYGRHASFCGSLGVELCEPLSFKGRMGSGINGGRCGYADKALIPKYDWEKYQYTYRIWGRLTYNPDADPETWRRYLRKELQRAAQPAEEALANASRILPLITTTHGASGSNNTYWPEIYTNMPIVDAARRHPYRDSPSPQRFGTVSPFDPQLFSRVEDFVQELLAGKGGSKYSPLEVAQWLEDLANTASKNLVQAESRAASKTSPEFRRLTADVSIQTGLGLFFAWKLRSAALWALYERSNFPGALEEALKAYREARKAWVELVDRAQGVYVSDLSYGTVPHLRGHWVDRLPAIDEDIADMERRLEPVKGQTESPRDVERIRRAVSAVLARPRRPAASCRHTPSPQFRLGDPLEIELSFWRANPGRQVRLYYRHVNQAEVWRTENMQGRDDRYRAVIPGAYTRSPYPLQYYFELHEGAQGTWLYPGFEPNLSNQPYFVVRRLVNRT